MFKEKEKEINKHKITFDDETDEILYISSIFGSLEKNRQKKSLSSKENT
jgi:hypothetical protein